MVPLQFFSAFHCYSWHRSLLSFTVTQQRFYMSMGFMLMEWKHRFLLSQEPHQECLELLIPSQGGRMCKLSSWNRAGGSGVALGSGHNWLLVKGHMGTTSSQCDTKAAQISCEAEEESRASRCQRTRKSGAQLELGAVGEARAPSHLTGHYYKLGQLSSTQLFTERLHNRRISHLSSQGNGLCHSWVPWSWWNTMRYLKTQGSSKIFYVCHQLQQPGLKLHTERASGLGPGFAVPQCGSITSCSPHCSANAKKGFCCCNDCQVADLLKKCWMAWRQRTFLYCWQCWACC